MANACPASNLAGTSAPIPDSEIARERERLRESVELLGCAVQTLDQRLRVGGVVLQRPMSVANQNATIEQETYSDLGTAMYGTRMAIKGHIESLLSLLDSLAV